MGHNCRTDKEKSFKRDSGENIERIETINYLNAMNSVHFCSITHRSKQMHYFYYLKFKTIYNISL
jgi:hypothetical protein